MFMLSGTIGTVLFYALYELLFTLVDKHVQHHRYVILKTASVHRKPISCWTCPFFLLLSRVASGATVAWFPSYLCFHMVATLVDVHVCVC